MAQFPDGAVLDEVQRCHDLFSYIQGVVDKDGHMGLFILTGSQQLGLSAGISQSLAGMVGSLELLILSLNELKSTDRLSDDLETLLFTGGYPPIYNSSVENIAVASGLYQYLS